MRRKQPGRMALPGLGVLIVSLFTDRTVDASLGHINQAVLGACTFAFAHEP
jgi:hypothetical protein